MAYWLENSLGVAPQVGGFGTPNATPADTVYLLCDRPKVQFSQEKQELELLTGQIGSAAERLVGRKHGTLSFSMPLEGLKAGYDATLEDPGDTGVVPPWLAMMGNVLGSNIALSDTAAKFWKGTHLSVSEYTAAGVIAGCSSTLLKTDAPGTSNKIAVGELIIAATTGTDIAPQFGWSKAKAGQDITLFEATANVAAAADNVYGTGTAWLSSNHGSQIPMTFTWIGENAAAGYYLTDAICTGIKLTWESGAVPTIEFSFNFYNFQADSTIGGLEIPASYQRIPQIVGASNGRATLSGSQVCGLESTSIEYKVEIAELKCHSATQGIAGVTYRKPRVSVSASIPWSSSDPIYDSAGGAATLGNHYWQSLYERGVPVSVGCYVGSNVGRLFAFLVPAGRLVDVPQVTEINGAVGYQLSVEAGSYTGDTSDTAETAANSPLDSIFRLGVG